MLQCLLGAFTYILGLSFPSLSDDDASGWRVLPPLMPVQCASSAEVQLALITLMRGRHGSVDGALQFPLLTLLLGGGGSM
jgi:hypothetical protein